MACDNDSGTAGFQASMFLLGGRTSLSSSSGISRMMSWTSSEISSGSSLGRASRPKTCSVPKYPSGMGRTWMKSFG